MRDQLCFGPRYAAAPPTVPQGGIPRMEQMIWLAPWVLTEPWFSTLEALCHVVTTLEKNVTHFRYAGWQVVHAANETQRVPVTIHQHSETMTFNHCCFAIAPTTALTPRLRGVL